MDKFCHFESILPKKNHSNFIILEMLTKEFENSTTINWIMP
jgi:hypothetical protein